MFESLGNAIREEQEKLAKKQKWLSQLVQLLGSQEFLIAPFVEETLVHALPTSMSQVTQIAGVDGGIVSEAMTGFDLALYRAVAAVFRGVGKKIQSDYIPHFDPDPQIFFSPSLQSRQEFNHMCTLLRLYAEYEVAKMTIQQSDASVIYIDGKVAPLQSDFSLSNPSKLVLQAEQDVKKIYEELVDLAFGENVLLCGIVKDSRSREYTSSMGKILPQVIQTFKLDKKFMQYWPYMLDDLQDSQLGDTILQAGERTAWLKSSLPSWLDTSLGAEIRTCLVKPLADDQPIRIEIIVPDRENGMGSATDIALAAVHILTNHGMALAIPTIILEADQRTKLSADHLDAVIDQISLTLGVPREHLRKRRFYSSSLS